MARPDTDRHSPGPALWFLLALGAAGAAGAGWLAARTRRDRLVAEAGEVLHPVHDAAPDGGEDPDHRGGEPAEDHDAGDPGDGPESDPGDGPEAEGSGDAPTARP